MELIMSTGTENISKNVVLHLKGKAVADGDIKAKLTNLDDNIQQMLLWSAACTLWGFLVIVVTTVGMYAIFTGEHIQFLIDSLIPVYLLMGIIIFYIWKGSNYKRSHFDSTRKNHVAYQEQKLKAQSRLMLFYLLQYTMLSITVCIFFSIQAHYSLFYLFKIMGLSHAITYGLGLYFIATFKMQLKQLKHLYVECNQLYIKSLNKN